LIFRNRMWHSRGRWNLINAQTQMAVSSIFLEIWDSKVWAQIFLNQGGISSNNPWKFFFLYLQIWTHSTEIDVNQMIVSCIWSDSSYLLKFSSPDKINSTYPSQIYKVWNQKREGFIWMLDFPLCKSFLKAPSYVSKEDDQLKFRGDEIVLISHYIWKKLFQWENFQKVFSCSKISKFFSFQEFLESL